MNQRNNGLIYQNRAVKVLHFRQSNHIWGPEKGILNLCERLAAFGFLCEIAIMYRCEGSHLTKHPLVDEAQKKGIPITQLNGHWSSLIEAIRWLRRKLLHEKFSLLHTHEFKTTILGAIASWGIPPSSLSLIATDHGLFIEHSWQLRIFRALELAVLYKYHHITVNSRSQFKKLAIYPHLRRRIRVVPDGVYEESLSPGVDHHLAQSFRNSLGVREHDPVISIIGRLEPEKGHRLFLESASKVLLQRPDARFWIVGDGSLRKALEIAVSQMQLTNAVSFLGYRSDIANVMAASDVIVISSKYESFSKVLLESLWLAKTVVATSVGAIPEVIRDGETGILVPPQNVEALATAILHVIEDRSMAIQLGLKGQHLVREKYSSMAAAEAMAAFYREVLTCMSS